MSDSYIEAMTLTLIREGILIAIFIAARLFLLLRKNGNKAVRVLSTATLSLMVVSRALSVYQRHLLLTLYWVEQIIWGLSVLHCIIYIVAAGLILAISIVLLLQKIRADKKPSQAEQEDLSSLRMD